MKHTFFLTSEEYNFFKLAIMKVWESGWTGKRPDVISQQHFDYGHIVCIESNTQDFATLMIRTGQLMTAVESVAD